MVLVATDKFEQLKLVKDSHDSRSDQAQHESSSTRKGCLEQLGEANENAYISDVIGQTVPKFYVDVLTSLLYSHTNFEADRTLDARYANGGMRSGNKPPARDRNTTFRVFKCGVS